MVERVARAIWNTLARRQPNRLTWEQLPPDSLWKADAFAAAEYAIEAMREQAEPSSARFGAVAPTT